MRSGGYIPQVLYVVVTVMVIILCGVMLLFYRKRKESLNLKPQIEKMTRSLKRIGRSVIPKHSSKEGSSEKVSAVFERQVPYHRDTTFWVPEVYNSIVQPTSIHPRKVTRLTSTLDREIYSKAHDTSYLQAKDTSEVFEDCNKWRNQQPPPSPKSPIRGNERRLTSDPVNRGMLNFTLQYKADLAIVYVGVVRAEDLLLRRTGEPCNPFVYIQVTPTYKRHMHSEVHQKTQNPVFNQVFEFEVPPYEIREQAVTFTVLDFNQAYTHWNHETVGTVTFRLDTLEHDAFFAGKEFTLWNKLEGQMDEDRMASCNRYLEYPKEMDLNKEEMLLLVSIKFVKKSQKLDVCIKQARNLPVNDKKGKLDHPYASISLKHEGHVVKKSKTNVIKNNRNPCFNKTINFDIQGTSTNGLLLTVKLKNSELTSRDRPFAILQVGPEVGEGSGKQQWTDVMAAGEAGEGETIERWHVLVAIEVGDD